MKDLNQKCKKVKLFFQRRLYRLPGTGIVECLEISDVGCNLTQFDGLTRLTLQTPIFYDNATVKMYHYIRRRPNSSVIDSFVNIGLIKMHKTCTTPTRHTSQTVSRLHGKRNRIITVFEYRYTD